MLYEHTRTELFKLEDLGFAPLLDLVTSDDGLLDVAHKGVRTFHYNMGCSKIRNRNLAAQVFSIRQIRDARACPKCVGNDPHPNSWFRMLAPNAHLVNQIGNAVMHLNQLEKLKVEINSGSLPDFATLGRHLDSHLLRYLTTFPVPDIAAEPFASLELKLSAADKELRELLATDEVRNLALRKLARRRFSSYKAESQWLLTFQNIPSMTRSSLGSDFLTSPEFIGASAIFAIDVNQKVMLAPMSLVDLLLKKSQYYNIAFEVATPPYRPEDLELAAILHTTNPRRSLATVLRLIKRNKASIDA